MKSSDKDLLDEEDFVLGNDTMQKGVKHLSGIIILWIGMVATILLGGFFDLKIQVSFTILIAVSLFSFYNSRVGSIVVLGLILTSVFGLFEFFVFHFSFNMKIFGLSVYLNLLMVLIAVIHYYSNRQFIDAFMLSIFALNQERETERNRSQVEMLKNTFNSMSLIELERMSKDESLRSEAIFAIKELIIEKTEN